MSNYSIKLNLLKFKSACVVDVKGKTTTKKGVFIPIEDNGLFVSTDENLNAKAVYADLAAWESSQSKYGDTHGVKLSLPKEMREKMNEEELKSIPFIGNMKPIETANTAASVSIVTTATINEAENNELPF